MKNSGKFQNSMRAVTINSEFSLPGLKSCLLYCYRPRFAHTRWASLLLERLIKVGVWVAVTHWLRH